MSDLLSVLIAVVIVGSFCYFLYRSLTTKSTFKPDGFGPGGGSDIDTQKNGKKENQQ
jgi:hypothetical protein